METMGTIGSISKLCGNVALLLIIFFGLVKMIKSIGAEDRKIRIPGWLFWVVVIIWSVVSATTGIKQLAQEDKEGTSNRIVQIIDEQPEAQGTVVEAPIPLGGGLCLVGVSVGDFHDGRDVRAVLVSADRPLVVGQKVKVKVRLVSETYRPAIDLLVIQDDDQK